VGFRYLGRVTVVLLIEVIVHAIDVERHPTIPSGWRWCVQLGGEPYDDKSRMLNAAWCPTRHEACVEGEMVAVAAVKALRLCGQPVDYRGVVELAADPIMEPV
jgi:hypothetical protein